MRLCDFVLAVFKKGKKPEDLKGIRQIKNLNEIRNSVSSYCVYRGSKSVTASRIKEFYPNSRSYGRFEGEIEIGRYDEFEGSYHLITKYEVSKDSSNQGFIKQKDLKDKENYIEEGL